MDLTELNDALSPFFKFEFDGSWGVAAVFTAERPGHSLIRNLRGVLTPLFWDEWLAEAIDDPIDLPPEILHGFWGRGIVWGWREPMCRIDLSFALESKPAVVINERLKLRPTRGFHLDGDVLLNRKSYVFLIVEGSSVGFSEEALPKYRQNGLGRRDRVVPEQEYRQLFRGLRVHCRSP